MEKEIKINIETEVTVNGVVVKDAVVTVKKVSATIDNLEVVIPNVNVS